VSGEAPGVQSKKKRATGFEAIAAALERPYGEDGGEAEPPLARPPQWQRG